MTLILIHGVPTMVAIFAKGYVEVFHTRLSLSPRWPVWRGFWRITKGPTVKTQESSLAGGDYLAIRCVVDIDCSYTMCLVTH